MDTHPIETQYVDSSLVVNPPMHHISLMKSNKSAPNDLFPEVASELCEIR